MEPLLFVQSNHYTDHSMLALTKNYNDDGYYYDYLWALGTEWILNGVLEVGSVFYFILFIKSSIKEINEDNYGMK